MAGGLGCKSPVVPTEPHVISGSLSGSISYAFCHIQLHTCALHPKEG